MNAQSTAAPLAGPIPIREGLLSAPLDDLNGVRLMGSRCGNCREVTLGVSPVCPNCGLADAQAVPLSAEGTLWTYTVVRYKPPGNYRGPEPFVPFAMGLVELPEGLRVLAPLAGDPSQYQIGIRLRLHTFVRSAQESPAVVSFAFAPLEQRS